MSKKPKGPFKLDPQEIQSLLNTKPTEGLQKQIASEQDGNFATMPIDELIEGAAETKKLPMSYEVHEEDPREAEKRLMEEIDDME